MGLDRDLCPLEHVTHNLTFNQKGNDVLTARKDGDILTVWYIALALYKHDLYSKRFL